MKKVFYLLVLLLLAFNCYSEIGDNFEAGGIAIGGNVGFMMNFNDPFSEESSRYINFNISPRIEFLIVNNVAFSLSPRVSFQRSIAYNDSKYNMVTTGLRIGFSYFIVPNPGADKGIVIEIGGDTGFSFTPGRKGTDSSGNDYSDDSLKAFRLYLSPGITTYFFITEVIAPYIRFDATFYLPIKDYDWDGNEYTTSLGERMDINTYISFGISFFIQNKKKVLIEI